MVVSVVLAPEFPRGFTDRLAAVDEGGTSATVSAVTFGLAQLPFFGGISIAMLAMAADAPHRAIHTDLLEQIESGPAAVFMAMGLLGSVLGILLLGIGLFRAHVIPRWVQIMLWAFLVVEFAGSALSEWASSPPGFSISSHSLRSPSHSGTRRARAGKLILTSSSSLNLGTRSLVP
jgi:hypothetical protein